MNFLVIDGNSLINRAFYGIKLLTAKDGHYTNAIFGFLNMYFNLLERTKADAVAVAFDLKAPTFRHKMFAEYKAGRKPMPTELHEQMQPIKDILTYLGCHIVSCEGYEADDILGTLSAHTDAKDHCFLATGDRDSLQLVRDNVTVLLPSTKMGQTTTEEFTPDAIFAKYGVRPEQMIEIKALQGDSSDNIPGVAGIGEKTAGNLIQKYGSVEYIYENLSELETTENIRRKLTAGKESAFLSKKLGTICLSAPIESDPKKYILLPRNDDKLREALISHEMFKLLSKLKLGGAKTEAGNKENAISTSRNLYMISSAELSDLIAFDNEFFIAPPILSGFASKLYFATRESLYMVTGSEEEIISSFSLLIKGKLITTESKNIYRLALDFSLPKPDIVFDIKLAAYLLNPNAADYDTASIAMSYGVSISPVFTERTSLSEDDRLILSEVSAYELLKNRLSVKLEECEQLSLLTDVEIPLAEVLADMERAGMAVDPSAIANYSVLLSQKIDLLQEEIFRDAGEEFNINSPKQLGVVLFEKLGLPAKKKTKTGYSTNAEVLEELSADYPIVEKILSYRTFSKLKSTYCDGLLKAVAPDGRIHSTFNQTETRTGRLSSTEPNLQNIPVRTETGREFRKFFVAKEGYLLVDADYSQIELRVLAALANDKTMLECFNSGIDIHTTTAAKVFGISPENVTPELRSRAKAVNFGIVYGIGAFSLSKDIHVSRAEADSFIKAYLGFYSSVDAYMQSSIQKAKDTGYAETLFHRRRYLPELSSSNGMLRSFGERVARNMPIQGTAADIIKIAMIKVHTRLKNEMPEAKLIMQVHDELIIEAPEASAEKAAAILKSEMENAVLLSVRLSVDANVGKTWYEAKG